MTSTRKFRLGYVLCEYERDHMAQMHAVRAWPTASIQKERLSLLISIQDTAQLPFMPIPFRDNSDAVVEAPRTYR